VKNRGSSIPSFSLTYPCSSVTVLVVQKAEIQKIYSRYSRFYDIIFEQFFYPRIRLGLEKIGIQSGDRIIEVGVGTGFSLSLYPETCQVVGIDITRRMLERAKAKKEKLGLSHIDLFEMDGENICFDDDSFDHAVLPFVISVVPNLERLMAEIKRVTKKGGKIIIMNHLYTKFSWVSRMEEMLSPFFMKLGWNAGLSIDMLSNHCNLHIEEVSRKHKLDPWFILNATNRK
jgi:phosphatidylethanolamine/phosphatidyl-N-methylethanolamine N-methyltransferase